MSSLARLPYQYPYAPQDATADVLAPQVGRLPLDSSLAGGASVAGSSHGRQATRDPTVTGTSVIAFKYADGVMLAGDTLGSYGSMARFRSLERVRTLGRECVIGATGEYSDFQYLHREMEFIVQDDEHAGDGHTYSPRALFSVLARIMYNRRTYKMDPLYNHFVVAGFRGEREHEDGASAGSFLATTDLNGTNYEDDMIATGYGGHLAMPLLRRDHRNDLSFAEAKELMEKCLKVCFYRDARTINKVQIATVTKDGPSVSEPYELDTDWRVGKTVYAAPVKTSFPYGDGSSNADAAQGDMQD
jgi:20S proteasome subunit beta 7